MLTLHRREKGRSVAVWVNGHDGSHSKLDKFHKNAPIAPKLPSADLPIIQLSVCYSSPVSTPPHLGKGFLSAKDRDPRDPSFQISKMRALSCSESSAMASRLMSAKKSVSLARTLVCGYAKLSLFSSCPANISSKNAFEKVSDFL